MYVACDVRQKSWTKYSTGSIKIVAGFVIPDLSDTPYSTQQVPAVIRLIKRHKKLIRKEASQEQFHHKILFLSKVKKCPLDV